MEATYDSLMDRRTSGGESALTPTPTPSPTLAGHCRAVRLTCRDWFFHAHQRHVHHHTSEGSTRRESRRRREGFKGMCEWTKSGLRREKERRGERNGEQERGGKKGRERKEEESRGEEKRGKEKRQEESRAKDSRGEERRQEESKGEERIKYNRSEINSGLKKGSN